MLHTALQYGLVNHVFPQRRTITKNNRILQIIINKAPLAIQNALQAANAVFQTEWFSN